MVALIGGLGPMELGIVLVLVLILFGAGKLPQVFEAFGKSVKSFRDAQKDDAIDVSPQLGADDDLLDASSKVREADTAHR